MNSTKIFRPTFRALQRQPAKLRSLTIARSALASAQTRTRNAPPAEQIKGLTLLRADGMPQLVPFFFVNEVTFAFGLLAGLTYISAKYILPRYPRLFLSRLFISKL